MSEPLPSAVRPIVFNEFVERLATDKGEGPLRRGLQSAARTVAPRSLALAVAR